jgi:toxin-antitoxin system PIN domain toxin
MDLPDINVWIAWAFPAHVHHAAARAWFDGAEENRLCYFSRFTQQGFLRLANNPAVIGSAVTQDQAWQLYDHFLAHWRVEFASEPPGLEPLWRQWTQQPQFSAKAWSDAYLAAFALASGYEVVTFDKGFQKYQGVRCLILG